MLPQPAAVLNNGLAGVIAPRVDEADSAVQCR